MREDLIRVGYCMAAVPVRRMRILEIIRPNYTLCGVMARATHSKIELFIVIQLFCLWRWCMVVLWPWWLLPWLHDCETGFNIFIIHGFRVWEAWAGRQPSNRINQICVWVCVCMYVCIPYQCYHCNGLNMSMSHVPVWAWEVRWHCDILHWDCSDLIIDANMWHNGDTRWVVTTLVTTFPHVPCHHHKTPWTAPHQAWWHQRYQLFVHQLAGCHTLLWCNDHIPCSPSHTPHMNTSTQSKIWITFLASKVAVLPCTLGRNRGKTDEIPHKSRH